MYLFFLKTGLIFFHLTYKLLGLNFRLAHRIYVKLYCLTNGKIDSYLNKNSQIGQNGGDLNTKGYIKLSENLDKQTIDNLIKFSQKSNVIDDHGNKNVFNENRIESVLYRYDENDLINNQDIQSLICNEDIIQSVTDYFGSNLYFEMVAMWWTTDYNKTPSKEAAQWFHFDLDRVNWLKVFIYLNVVDMNNGPHCYVEGSHIINSKPEHILRRGYVRISDEEIIEHYGKDKIKYITSKPGEIYIGNTKAWHKGTHINKGKRLILQLQYTDSFFLLNPTKQKIEVKSNKLKSYLEKNPSFLMGKKILK